MEGTTNKPSPFPPASEVPLHRNPPLAPSQEMAYRNKCIQLKRRLTEIETNNDSTRRRILTERERVAKMRFLRAILLNQLKELMETPGEGFTFEQLEELGITEDKKSVIRPKGEERLLDDSSDESDNDDLPEPMERPTRTRRANNNYRESIMNTNPGSAQQYQNTGLPQLAPANSYPAARDSIPLTSSFHVGSTSIAADSPPQSYVQPYGAESRYSHQSSPVQHNQAIYQDSPNGAPLSPIQRPTRPKLPLAQFYEHMRPQLEADHYPSEQIEERIDAEWRKLSDSNRDLWEARYHEQMLDYQALMDQWRRSRRREQSDYGSAKAGFTNLNPR